MKMNHNTDYLHLEILSVNGGRRMKLSKENKKLLQKWCSIAYERELGSELGKLHDQFHLWKDGKLHPIDLSDEIHKFHDGAEKWTQ
jgi:hypothetical protein